MVKAPVLDNCPAHVACKVADVVKRGDHTVFVAEVVKACVRTHANRPCGRRHLVDEGPRREGVLRRLSGQRRLGKAAVRTASASPYNLAEIYARTGQGLVAEVSAIPYRVTRDPLLRIIDVVREL